MVLNFEAARIVLFFVIQQCIKMLPINVKTCSENLKIIATHNIYHENDTKWW